jgi:hypothetical protein
MKHCVNCRFLVFTMIFSGKKRVTCDAGHYPRALKLSTALNRSKADECRSYDSMGECDYEFMASMRSLSREAIYG